MKPHYTIYIKEKGRMRNNPTIGIFTVRNGSPDSQKDLWWTIGRTNPKRIFPLPDWWPAWTPAPRTYISCEKFNCKVHEGGAYNISKFFDKEVFADVINTLYEFGVDMKACRTWTKLKETP